MSRKTYFPVNSFDYAPDELIQVGQIICDPKAPTKAINKAILPKPKLHHSYKDNWHKEKEKVTSGSVGIWASFLAMILGLGGDLTASLDKDHGDILKFQRLDTYFIQPTDEYVKASMQTEAVAKFFLQNPEKTPFMITGIKIARGAHVIARRKHHIGVEAKTELDAAALAGAPVSVGPKVALSRKVVDSESFTDSSDFVFAYRLSRIYIRRRTHDIYSKEFVKGALYTSEVAMEDVPAWVDDWAPTMDFEVMNVDKGDFSGEDELSGYSSVVVRDEDGDEDCKLICLFGEKIGPAN